MKTLEQQAEEAFSGGYDELAYRLFMAAAQEYRRHHLFNDAARCQMRARKAWTVLTGEEFV